MQDIEKILDERKETHGKFEENAKVVQGLKDAVRLSSKMEHMHKGHKEAVDAILCKVGRIVVGNPFEPDHWDDIKGYAELGKRISSKKECVREIGFCCVNCDHVVPPTKIYSIDDKIYCEICYELM